jgi:hypothetical protein
MHAARTHARMHTANHNHNLLEHVASTWSSDQSTTEYYRVDIKVTKTTNRSVPFLNELHAPPSQRVPACPIDPAIGTLPSLLQRPPSKRCSPCLQYSPHTISTQFKSFLRSLLGTNGVDCRHFGRKCCDCSKDMGTMMSVLHGFDSWG